MRVQTGARSFGCCGMRAGGNRAYRRVLWAVLAINTAMFLVELGTRGVCHATTGGLSCGVCLSAPDICAAGSLSHGSGLPSCRLPL